MVIKNNMPYKLNLETWVLIKERMSSEAPTMGDIYVQWYIDLSWKELINICLMIFLSLRPQ